MTVKEFAIYVVILLFILIITLGGGDEWLNFIDAIAKRIKRLFKKES